MERYGQGGGLRNRVGGSVLREECGRGGGMEE